MKVCITGDSEVLRDVCLVNKGEIYDVVDIKDCRVKFGAIQRYYYVINHKGKKVKLYEDEVKPFTFKKDNHQNK